MIRVLIDGRPCEFDIEPKIILGYRSDDLSDVESSRKGQSVVVRVPFSVANDEILGHAVDLKSAEGFNAEYHKATIEADGEEVFCGTAYLDGVEVENGAVAYILRIVGGATQWAKQAAREMFNLINLDFDAMLDMVEIGDSWTSSSPVKFLPVQREDVELQNGQTSMYIPEKILTTEDYHPFISVAALVKAIFEGAGYSVESRFLESEWLRSIYISGAYSLMDVDAKLQRMDFRAGRLEGVTATANYAGRVYASPASVANSVGNIVDTTASEVIDKDGNVVETGLFALNDCFAIDEDGFAEFRPLSAVKVGFEYHLKFACNYRIESRDRLKSFDTLYLGDGVTLPFRLINRFKDCRGDVQALFNYRVVLFDYSEQYQYRIVYRVNGVWNIWANVTSRTALISSPADIAQADAIELQRKPLGASRYSSCSEDWAMYEGYVDYEGTIEVETTLRMPAVEVSPSSPKRFDSLYFGGAEEGMSLTILPGTTLRPIFTSTIGYGSHLTFEDVAQIKVRQSVFLEAVQHLFNLRFYTNERLKVVYVEPYDDFIRRDEVFDWSDRIDYGESICIEPMANEVHERRTLGYIDGDGAVSRYNAECETVMGEWSFEASSRASIEGEQSLISPLFAPTVSIDQRFVNAESARVMQIYDEAALAESGVDGGFTPRVVRYVGMSPLPEGERWGYPYSGTEYPLAAFHYAGDGATDGFTLCFEDRDGCEGLHTFYDREYAEESTLHSVSLTMHIRPEEYAALFNFVDKEASIRSLFALRIRGEVGYYRLHSIEEYNLATGRCRCRFAQVDTLAK
jgi:hypothetical protein